MKEFQPAEQFQFFLMGRTARRILAIVGTEVGTYAADIPTYQKVIKATIGIDGSDFLDGPISEAVLPTLSIARPVDQTANWEYEIDYAAHDADLSRRVVVRNDPMIGMHGLVSKCLGTGERDMLSAQGAEGIINDLDRQLESMSQVVLLSA